jgi:hypothetical protein
MINDFSVNAAWSTRPELAESMDQAAVLMQLIPGALVFSQDASPQKRESI